MKLKELRAKENKTQQQVADFLNIPQQRYLNYEKEKTQPPIELLIRLANYFNVSLDYLCDNEQATKKVVYLDNLTREQSKLIEIIKENEITNFDIEIVQQILRLNDFRKGNILGKIENQLEEQEKYKIN